MQNSLRLLKISQKATVYRCVCVYRFQARSQVCNKFGAHLSVSFKQCCKLHKPKVTASNWIFTCPPPPSHLPWPVCPSYLSVAQPFLLPLLFVDKKPIELCALSGILFSTLRIFIQIRTLATLCALCAMILPHDNR